MRPVGDTLLNPPGLSWKRLIAPVRYARDGLRARP